MFNFPKLKHAFSESGGQKPPPREEHKGVLDYFKAEIVDLCGPTVSRRLSDTFTALQSRSTEDGTPEGRPKDVQAYVALERIGRQIEHLKQDIQEGGARGFDKMREAHRFVKRLQQRGLEA